MKKVKCLSLMLISVLFSAFVISCSSDDDEVVSNYTSDEILELLKGKWSVNGETKLVSETDNFAGKYKGTLEFFQNKYNEYYADFEAKEGDKYNYHDYEFFPQGYFIGHDRKVTVMKQGGKNYLLFGSSKFPFEIIKLNKTTLKLKLDTDFENDVWTFYGKQYHVYITIQTN